MSSPNVFVRVMGVTAVHFLQAETVSFSLNTSQFVNISACSQIPGYLQASPHEKAALRVLVDTALWVYVSSSFRQI